MRPPTCERNLTPSSIALASALLEIAGVVDRFQTLHGQIPGARVVKDHVKLAASGFPARSLTPEAPPLIVAAYTALFASTVDKRSVTVRVTLSYDTAAGTSALDESRSSNVAVLIDDASIDSLN